MTLYISPSMMPRRPKRSQPFAVGNHQPSSHHYVHCLLSDGLDLMWLVVEVEKLVNERTSEIQAKSQANEAQLREQHRDQVCVHSCLDTLHNTFPPVFIMLSSDVA
jgi:hypothetical protein